VIAGEGSNRVRAVLLDIEGTTTPITFVTDVLFPYARRRLRTHLEAHASEDEYTAILLRLRGEHTQSLQDGEPAPPWPGGSASDRLSGAVAFLEWLMDRDRKSTALKELQGRIWERGYERGEIVGDVFADVRPALERWRDRQMPVGIFSSGSVLAQQLLFRHSSAGNLTGLIRWHFDTHIGAKSDAESYRRIAHAIALPADAVLFLSDIGRELDAARAAGMQVRLVVRPGNAQVSGTRPDEVIHSLEELP
jgi:enolase-phosphatase E1